MGSFYGNAVSAVNSQSSGTYFVRTQISTDDYGTYLTLLDSWENIFQELNKGPVMAKYEYTKEYNSSSSAGEELNDSYKQNVIAYLPIYSAFVIYETPQGSGAPFAEPLIRVYGLQVGWLQENEETNSTSFEIKQAATNQSTSNPAIVISEGEHVPIIPTPGGGEIGKPVV